MRADIEEPRHSAVIVDDGGADSLIIEECDVGGVEDYALRLETILDFTNAFTCPRISTSMNRVLKAVMQ